MAKPASNPKVVRIGARALAKKKWEGSGLTDEHARALCLEPLDAEETRALGPEFHAVASLKIPYFDLKGKPTGFYRIRYLDKLPGFAGLVAKPQRYVQPKGSLSEVYFPPLLEKSWGEIAKDTSTDVWITEGEFKAAKACAESLVCIGLGGVDMWKASSKGFDLLPQLQPESFAWKGRKVFVCFDSDAASNEKVISALLRLLKKLHAMGAIPHIVSLPPGAGGVKVGLDDYLLTHTIEELKSLAATSLPYAAAHALWEMNSELIVIHNPAIVYVQATGEMIRARDFKELTHADRHYEELVVQANGTVLKRRDTAVEWLKWPGRNALRGITYAPGKERVVDGKLNTWKGWAVPSIKGDVDPWLEFMAYIFKDQPKEREWFERWLAFPIQHPGTKLYTAPVLWGVVQGTGKSLVAETVKHIYGENYTKIGNAELTSTFNEWADSVCFAAMDEITGNDSRMDADKLKGMITQTELRLNKKFVGSYVVPDCINYFGSSNHPDSFFLEDHDRRFFVHEMPTVPMHDDFYTRYDHWMRKTDGPAHLRYYFEHLDLGDFNPRARAMETRAKRNMIEDNRSDLSTWVALLKRDPETALQFITPDSLAKCCVFTNDALLQAYDHQRRLRVTATGLGKELTRQGFARVNGGEPVRTAVGIKRLYIVRDAEYWLNAGTLACAKHFNEFFAPQIKEK